MSNAVLGKVLADKYRVDSVWREGATSSMYHGTHLMMDKPVSIKILSADLARDKAAVKRFADEARTISRVFHQNILNVTDYGSDKDGTVYIVFEDADGQTLKSLAAEKGPLELEQANHLFGQIADAVSAAHTQGLLHLNLGAENIIIRKTLNEADAVKVLGFGGPADSADGVPSEIAAYLSPEQCASDAAVDERADIYSLGVILFEMLAGEPPFRDETATATMLQHVDAIPPQVSAFRQGLPNDIEEVILTALSKNPDARYQTAGEFADAVNRAAVLAGSLNEKVDFAVPAEPVSPLAEPVPAQPENNLWKTAFIVLAGIVLLGAGFIYMTQVKQTNPTTQLQADANGMPVQPVNPPTGTLEQNLANMSSYTADPMNSNTMVGPPGGDGYDPWANPSSQPSGAMPGGIPYQVQPIAPPGQSVTLDGNSESPFMQDYVVVPKTAPGSNSNAAVQPTPKGKLPSNSNTAAAPAGTQPAGKPSPTPAKTAPTPAPAEKPKTETPAKQPAGTKPQSGKEKDT